MTTKTARSLGRYMASWLAETAIGGAVALAITNPETNLLILSGTDPTTTPPGNVSRHRAGWPGVSFDTVDTMRSRTARSPTTVAVVSLYSAVPQLGAETVEVAVHPLAQERVPDRRGCWQKRLNGKNGRDRTAP
jgi:hypothetical protein